jgi:thiamine-monophosphate kinase
MRSEFEFIRNLKKKYALARIGDDCAVLPKDTKTDLVITADLLVEDIDFRLDWTRPEYIGYKALAVSLSDIAAMGATPMWAMLSIGVPGKVWPGKFVDRFYEGWFELAARYKIELVGGDVSRTPEKIVVDSIVAGEVPKGKAILRSGAKPGDLIFVTGAVGGASGGLGMLESGFRFSTAGKKRKRLIARQLRPDPRVTIGIRLAAAKIGTSMIDISDGFSSDLGHLCAASGTGATIKNLPADTDLYEYFSDDAVTDLALNGGEDFELMFTVSPRRVSELEGLPVIEVGVITSEANKIELVRGETAKHLRPGGYRHF